MSALTQPRPLIDELVARACLSAGSEDLDRVHGMHERADHNLVKAQAILQAVACAGEKLEKLYRDNAIWAADSLIQEAREIYGEI